MEAAAASALTALGDKECDSGRCELNTAKATQKDDSTKQESEDSQDSSASGKRFLPEHKKPDAAPTFPEKLMNLMRFAEKQGEGFCVAWLEDGKSFVIRNPDEFTRKVVPQYFKPTKFSSFTRKLYRWGFRQINRGIGPDDPIIFGNEFFQRDNEHLMAKMRSITAAGTRKQEETRKFGGLKRAGDDVYDDPNQKRMLIDHLLQHQKASAMQNPPFYGNMSATGSLPLTSALRSQMSMGNMNHSHHNLMSMSGSNQMAPQMGSQMGPTGASGIKPYEMMNPAGLHHQQHQQHQHQGDAMMNQYMSNNGLSTSHQYPNSQSTADIVNAAIAALRYAS